METTTDLTELAEEYGIEPVAFSIYLENHHISAENAEEYISDFEDLYIGWYADKDDFVREYMDENTVLSGLPENLRYYFDWDALLRDLFLGGEVWEKNGYYFRSY